MHLQRPRIVAWRVADLGPTRSVLFVQCLNILDANPGPSAGGTLTTTTEVDPRRITIHGGERVGTPVRVPKAEHIHVKMEARAHVRDAQDGRRAFESGPGNVA